MICDSWAVVVVPFPFTEAPRTKRRPALALSTRKFNENGFTIFAMITTKSRPAWPGDIDLQDYPVAGLKTACIVRLKMFTLDNRLIVRQIGALSESDRAKTAQQIRSCLALQS